MLSVSTATVPQAMRPTIANASPSPPTLGRKDRRPWNCEYTFPKRRCRPSAARKKIIANGQEDATIGIDVHCQTVRFDSGAVDDTSIDVFGDFNDESSPQKTSPEPVDSVVATENTSRPIPFVKVAQMQRVKVARTRDDDIAESVSRNPVESVNTSNSTDSADDDDGKELSKIEETVVVADVNCENGKVSDDGINAKRPKFEKTDDATIAHSVGIENTEPVNSPILGSRILRAVELLNRRSDENVEDIVNDGAPGIPGEEYLRDAIENFPPVMDDNGWDEDGEMSVMSNLRDDDSAGVGHDYPGKEDISSEESSLEHDEPFYMIGFPNPPGENRCWLNATLHAMFALPLFDEPEKLDGKQLRGCSQLTKTLMALRLFWGRGAEEKQKTYQTVKLFKESMGILDESYPSQRQQDVSEFLTMFLNYLKTDFEKLSSNVSDENIEETENIPDNVQNCRMVPRSPQTPTKRTPLAEISPGKRKSGENGDSAGLLTPKSRRIGLTYSAQDLLSPRVKRIVSRPTDPSYIVHTPPHRRDAAIQQMKENADFSKNPIDRYFLLHMMEHYSCNGCSKHRQRKVDNLMLYVDLPPESENRTVSLDEAIKASMRPEERILTCAKCNHDKHEVFTTFRTCPKILMVQVNRYGMCEDGSVAKFNTPVEIPETLQLEVGSPDPETGYTAKEDFEPVCVIAHVGSAMDCGHYTSYVRRGDDSWYHYNDLMVTPMSRYEALVAAQTTAYVVFFVSSKL